MPWREVTMESARLEFVTLALEGSVSMGELCRQYGVSRPTGYKWVERYRAEGERGLADRSRRPHGSPKRSTAALEAEVLDLRTADATWGGRKLRAQLSKQRQGPLPSASTITEILRRHGKLGTQAEGHERPATRRFEAEAPNDLWQMDFKGDFAFADGSGRCYPFTLLDDHSRFNLALQACLNQREATIRDKLTAVFERNGMPKRITCDNGPPWGSSSAAGVTPLGVWLVRLGVTITHSRPGHPQTQGKLERLHRTLDVELLNDTTMVCPTQTQLAFDRWQERYNHVRPHDALALAVPASRYQASSRGFPSVLLPLEYDDGEIVRKVQAKGEISFRGEEHLVGRGLRGMPVAIRESEVEPGVFGVYFLHQYVRKIEVGQEVHRG